MNKNKKICYELKNHGARVIANHQELTTRILRSTKDGDIEFIKLLYFAGVKNLHEYVNTDNRSIAHIVTLLFIYLFIYLFILGCL